MGDISIEQSVEVKIKRPVTEEEPKQESRKRKFMRVCVFCGSSSGNKDIFSKNALSLGRELVIILVKHMNLFHRCLLPHNLAGIIRNFL